MINFRHKKTFEGGYSTDTTNNVEASNTYQKAVSGRLYSKDGVFSFSGGKGTKLVYQNDNIVKYLNYQSFKDETIVFAKCIKGTELGGTTETVEELIIIANSFDLIDSADSITPLAVTTEITDNTSEVLDTYTIYVPNSNPIDFEVNFSDIDESSQSVDLSFYYKENANVLNRGLCSLSQDEVPINNTLYDDCIISLKKDNNMNLYGTLLWVGQQNWPLNGKITSEGVDENEYYKRVYYTDAINNRRVVNIKDTSLAYRSADEFNQILNNVLLQPEIIGVVLGGQLKAMKTLYVYRIISANGQLSEFSPSSKFAKILYDTSAISYRGGNVSESTGYSVKVRCNTINPESSAEIQCIALEYEAYGPPTAIRNLGTKSLATIVEFQHYGNEDEFADNVTYNDIINYTNTWKYCNDFSSKKNKLIAGGLRSEPIPSAINNLEYLFPLHSWKSDGSTHSSLMNPEPWTYRYIDPTNTQDIIYVKQKVYRTISSFGPLTIKFKNTATSDEIELELLDLSLESYTNITTLIIAWLLDEKINNPDFATYFPNLEIINSQNQLLFSPIDENIQTDMSNYIFESNNDQFIESFDNDIVFLPVTVNTSRLVHGAQSIGFNNGIGLRITYREFKEPLLNQATSVYTGSGNLLDYITPSGETYFMKGEIYRIAFQAFNNNSTRYFAIPLGDLMIPSLGDLKSSIDDAGNPIITSQTYVNQSVENGVLYGHGIKMHIEVRLSCELQKLIPMYQIVYVERTEDNRTILCQGISGPLERVQDTGREEHRMKDALRNKWNLPYYGGPTWEKKAFQNYDIYGENDQYTGSAADRRVMAHRALMYFDSPDLYYDKISDQHINNSQLQIIGKLNTDHTKRTIRNRGGQSGDKYNTGSEVYPKFSRKILEKQIEGNNNSDNFPKYDMDRGSESGTDGSHWINVSVYANYTPHNETKIIDVAKELLRGEVISGTALNVLNDVSNNACCLAVPEWYYGGYQRKWTVDGARANSDIFTSNMTSPGYKTIMIKTTTDLFTTSFLGNELPPMDPRIRLGGSDFNIHYDTVPLINIFRNNRDSVYGGRSLESYSKNTYIPLSRTIPTLQTSNSAQIFDVGADIYVTLNIRTKNDYGDDEYVDGIYENGGSPAGSDREIETWTRNGAWVYAVVLETQVEPKDTYQYECYKVNGTHSFQISRPEIINTAYFNENNLKSYVPKPFKFKDDPNRGNVIAVSDVKLAGELYDSWTVFKTNNFYSLLEKNKGDVTNFAKFNEELFSIQEQQTSLIYIGTDRIITDSQGGPINVQQGSGSVVDGHKIISPFGTSIRRAVVQSDDYGFTFFDERKIEFVKIKDGLLSKNFLHLEYFNKHKHNPIIDTEGYYDHEHKETCIRIRTDNGQNYMLSYNEALQKFNGEFPIQFDKDLFIQFDEKVYAPIRTNGDSSILSTDLHQLNEGDILNFFNEQVELTLGFYINSDIDKVFQYKQLGIITNLVYPIKQAFGKSNLGYDRTILGLHNWYKIREGIHTVPMINETNDNYEATDIRGNWVYIEITAESLNKNKVDILSVLSDLRFSHQ